MRLLLRLGGVRCKNNHSPCGLEQVWIGVSVCVVCVGKMVLYDDKLW